MNSNDNSAKKKGGVVKGVIGGMLAGAAVSSAGIFLMTNSKREMEKKANKVADAMANLANSAADMFK